VALFAALSLGLGWSWLYARQVQRPAQEMAGRRSDFTATLCGYAVESDYGARAVLRLESVPGVSVFRGGENQSGLCSMTIGGMDCEEMGEALARRGIAVRAGLHCAPLAHQTAGTQDTGTVRLSFSAFNRQDQVDRAAAVVRRLVREAKK